MYKIYINSTPLYLIAEENIKDWHIPDEKNMVVRYPGRVKFLFNYIDMLEKSDRFDSLTLYYAPLEKLKADFDMQFTILEAAGGLVLNQKSEILFIFRRGSWDLPKGKIDSGETIEQAAVREVQEETGLKEVEIIQPLDITFHTYKDKKNKRILKKTYWFIMNTNEQDLIPQLEEDIELASWMTLGKFNQEERVVYQNILDLLNVFSNI